MFKKKWGIAIAAALVAMTLVGCSGGNKPQERTKELMKQISGWKDSGIHLQMKAEMNMGAGNEQVTMDTYFKGSNVYMDIDVSAGKMAFLSKDGSAYIMMPAQKIYMEAPSSVTNDLPNIDDLFESAQSYENIQVTNGTEEINGATYDYEELKETSGTVRYYYDQSSGDLKFIKSQDQLIEILAFDNNVDETKFELPQDYKKM